MAAALAALAACGGSGSTGTPAGLGTLTLSATSITFPDTPIHSSAPTQNVSVSNTGTASVSITGIALSGDGAASFTLANGCGATLAPGAACSLGLGYAPSTAGATTATLQVSSGTGSRSTVALSGVGTVAAIGLSAPSVRFATTVVGQSAAPAHLTLTNTGSAPLTVTRLTISGSGAAAFTQADTCPTALPADASCTIQIGFTPNASGALQATLDIVSDAPGNPSVALAGLAVADNSPTAVLKALLVKPPVIAPYATASGSLGADLPADATALTVTAASGFPASGTFIAQLGNGPASEYVLVTGGAGTTSWSVIRGYNGSVASAFPTGSTLTWVPLATQKSATINGEPITEVAASFTASVGGQTGGTLASALQNGLSTFTFSDGEMREVTIQNGTSVTWSPALAAATIVAASVTPVRAPAGVASSNPVAILGQRFDLGAPVYITQHARLAQRGAVLTADLPAAGAATVSVDTTAGFPPSGSFVISTGTEDILVSVADPTTLSIVARGQDGTLPVALTGTASTFYQIFEVDFGNGGSQAFYAPGGLNSGLYYLGVAPTIAPLKEYAPDLPLSLHFVLDGSYFEVLASGNVSMFAIADGVVQQSSNYLVEPSYGGRYWHKFDFGSRRVRHISLFASAYPMSIATAPTDTIEPWDRSQDPLISWDGDSFGGTEGYRWSSSPDGSGLGFYFEMMLDLGITQFDFTGAIGGTGYSQQGPASPPAFPRPKYSAVNRVKAITAGPAPTLFFCGLGHNDVSIPRSQLAADTLSYWRSLRAAWPATVFVAAQYFFPAAGAAAPRAFEPNPRSTANDPLILAALEAIGGPWVYVNTNQGTWVNSTGATGTFATLGEPLITGAGFGGAPGYAGGHATGVGNGDLMIRDDGVHPSNLGARYLGQLTAQAIIDAVAAL